MCHAQGVDGCVMVRATSKTFDQDDNDDSDAGVFQQAGPFKRKEAGVATGSAAAELDGADGTARKAQKIKQTLDLSKRTVLDPSDPRPRTAYSLFVEERKHELQRQREHSGQPQASKGELQKATNEEWKAQDHAPRRRELEAQHKAAVGEWSNRQKLLQPAQVSPATAAGTSPMRRSQFVAGVTPEEVD